MTLIEGLAILGGVVLAGVVAHGAWQSRKASPRQAALPEAPRREPGLGEPRVASRVEPHGDGGADAAVGPGMADEVLGAVPAGASLAGADPAADAGAWPQQAPQPTGVGGFDALRQLPRVPARLDPLIDAIATLAVEGPVTGEAALMHMPATRRAGTKPFLIEGLEAETNAWEAPRPGHRYAEFQAGVQLANRSGALNEIEFSEFAQKLQGFADGVDARMDLPDMLHEVARARELDAFAGAHDAQLAVHLRANGASWTVAYLQQAAGRHGFVPGAVPGRLVLPAAEPALPPVLVLGFDAQAALADDPNQAAVRSVVLSLDVPQTAESAEPYPLWQDAARRLAGELDATIVDDKGHPITLHAFVAIGEDLKVLYEALNQHELAAGSALARRLFS